MPSFDPSILSDADRNMAFEYVGDFLTTPDIVLMPEGEPYLYRWHLVYNNGGANVFFHVQVASDPERPLHDHPWDNVSTILAGGYDEVYEPVPELVQWHAGRPMPPPPIRQLRPGDIVMRPAKVAHRLFLPLDVSYSMSLFTTGPKKREWGFWYPDGWHDNKRHVDNRADGTSLGKHGG